MFGLLKINVKEFNPLITCSICHGYLIDATSLSDCHHSFCRSCIAKHILTCNICPTCGLLIHKTRPESNLIDDKNLQQIVYKLVPGLLKDEINRRDEFYSKDESVSRGSDNSLSTLDFSDSIDVDEDVKICIVVHVLKAVRNSRGKISFTNKTKTFLFCPGLFTMRLLKKFFHDKCELEEDFNIELVQFDDDEFVPDHYTLLDVADVYNWRAESPLELKCIIWNDAIFSTSPSKEVDDKKLLELHPESTDCPFQSFKQFCKHLRRSNVCSTISPKKRHKRDRHKHALRDLTNSSEGIPSDPETRDGSSGRDSLKGNSVDVSESHQLGNKLKLRIRARGIEDSILILPSTSGSSSDSSVLDRSVGGCLMNSTHDRLLHLDDRHVSEGMNEKSDKKFKSKKDMFFSRLGLDTSMMSISAEDVSDSKVFNDKDDSFLSSINRTTSFGSPCIHKPLNVTIDEPNLLTPYSDTYNFKKKLLLATAPTRTRGQLWTPYKSPSKDTLQPSNSQISSAEQDRGRSPVIIFNPALPLPSFTSLLQSFNYRHDSDTLSTPDHSPADSNHDGGVNMSSKVGIFISKGRSMTLEEMTKLRCDVSKDQTFDCLEDESSVNKSLEELQDLFYVEKHDKPTGEHDLKIAERNFEATEIKPSIVHKKINDVNKMHDRFSKRESSKTCLGRKTLSKKSPSTGNESKDEGFVDEEMKSPQKKKPMLDNGCGEIENDFKDETSLKNDKGNASKICNISKRALKIIN